MRRIRLILVLGLIVAGGSLLLAHDMFLKPDQFFVAPNTEVLVRLLNGTFSQSENSIDRVRLVDVSVVSPAGRERVDTSRWSAVGDTSNFRFRTGATGTYLLGASTKPNIIPLTAKEFNEYLESDGIPDALEARRKSGELTKNVRERYAKHVTALLQVGETRSDHFTAPLGYPAEIIPQQNPYSVKTGDTIAFRLLVRGKPSANEYVLYGGRTPNGGRITQRSTRSDTAGVARIRISGPGTWYVKFIHMEKLSGDTAADYESTWSTVTFAIK